VPTTQRGGGWTEGDPQDSHRPENSSHYADCHTTVITASGLQPSLYERKKIAEGAMSGAVTDATIPNKSKGGGARRVKLSILSDSLAGGLQTFMETRAPSPEDSCEKTV
jgi:hypothetical protein